MSAPEVIVALYPPAVRERWGAEIGREVAERGPRTWADAILGAVRLWLHPRDWPETAAGQTRRVVAVALFAVTATATLLLRAAEPNPYPHATILWFAPLAAGALAAAPLPPLARSSVRMLVTVTVRTMTVPAVLVLAMVALAHSGLVDHPNVVLVAYYWSTLGYVALRTCTLIARILPGCAAPTTGRLRGALLLTGAGLAVAAGQGTLAVLHAAAGIGGLCITAALALLAAVTLRTGQNLDRSPV